MHCLQYLGDLGCEHVVYKNDEKTVDELRELNPRGILLSPGPGANNTHAHDLPLPAAYQTLKAKHKAVSCVWLNVMHPSVAIVCLPAV